MPQIPFTGKPPSDRYMEPSEFQQLIGAAKKDSVAVQVLLAMGLGGLRTIEVTWLDVHSLDPNKKGLWVKTAKRGDNHIRFVPLNNTSYKVFQTKRQDGPLIIHQGERVTRRRIRYLFHKYKQDAGIRDCLGPHSLRHLAAIVRTEAGASPQEVAGFMGHKTLQQVLVYSSLRTERNTAMTEEAAKVLGVTNGY
jgi:site-specific recombinase XerD